MERRSLTWRSREIINVMRRRACKHFVHAASIWRGQGARELGYRYKPLYSGGEDKKNGVGVILELEIKKKVVDVMRHLVLTSGIKTGDTGTDFQSMWFRFMHHRGRHARLRGQLNEDLEALIRTILSIEQLLEVKLPRTWIWPL